MVVASSLERCKILPLFWRFTKLRLVEGLFSLSGALSGQLEARVRSFWNFSCVQCFSFPPLSSELSTGPAGLQFWFYSLFPVPSLLLFTPVFFPSTFRRFPSLHPQPSS